MGLDYGDEVVQAGVFETRNAFGQFGPDQGQRRGRRRRS
jgi:hypothetical protein